MCDSRSQTPRHLTALTAYGHNSSPSWRDRGEQDEWTLILEVYLKTQGINMPVKLSQYSAHIKICKEWWPNNNGYRSEQTTGRIHSSIHMVRILASPVCIPNVVLTVPWPHLPACQPASQSVRHLCRLSNKSNSITTIYACASPPYSSLQLQLTITFTAFQKKFLTLPYEPVSSSLSSPSSLYLSSNTLW